MKKLLLIPILLLAPLAHGQAIFQMQKANGGAATPTGALVQNPIDNSCGASSITCIVPVAATGTGFGAIWAANNGGANVFIASVTGGCTGSWIVPVGGQWSGGGGTGAGSFAYCLHLSAGGTAWTMNWATASPGFSMVVPYEFSYTGSSVTFDTVGQISAAGAANPQPSPTLTLGGLHDIIIVGMETSAVTINSVAIYSNFQSNLGGSPGVAATAILLNTASGAPASFTMSGSAGASSNGIAFTLVP